MKSIKKIKKSTKAVAGSALLVGATLVGGASFALAQDSGSSGDSYDLGSYPNQPFVDEDGALASTVVVGEDAKAVDVVSAIDIAAQLGNNAYSTEEQTVEGGETTEVNGNKVNVDLANKDMDTLLTATSYDSFERNFEYDSEAELRVTEEATVNTGSSGNGIEVDGQGEARTVLETGEVSYTADYRPALSNEDSIYVLGNEYEITGLSDGEAELGSKETNRNLATGDTVEHGPYEVEVTDNDGEDTVYLTISQNGEIVAENTFTDGDNQTERTYNDEFTVTAPSIFFGNEERVTLETTYTDTKVTDGEASPWDEEYDVSLDQDGSDNISSITLSNNQKLDAMPSKDEEDLEDNQGYALGYGENLEGPNDYFSVSNLGLSDEATESISFSEDTQADFTDAEGLEQSLQFNEDLTDGQDAAADDIVGTPDADQSTHYPVTVDSVDLDADTPHVDVSYGAYEDTLEMGTLEDGTITSAASKVTSSSFIGASDVGDSTGETQYVTYNMDSTESSEDGKIQDGNNGDITLSNFDSTGNVDHSDVTVSPNLRITLPTAVDNDVAVIELSAGYDSGNSQETRTALKLEGDATNSQFDVSTGTWDGSDWTWSSTTTWAESSTHNIGSQLNDAANTDLQGADNSQISLDIDNGAKTAADGSANGLSGDITVSADEDLEETTGNTESLRAIEFSISGVDASEDSIGNNYELKAEFKNQFDDNTDDVGFEVAGNDNSIVSSKTGYGFTSAANFQDTGSDGNPDIVDIGGYDGNNFLQGKEIVSTDFGGQLELTDSDSTEEVTVSENSDGTNAGSYNTVYADGTESDYDDGEIKSVAGTSTDSDESKGDLTNYGTHVDIASPSSAVLTHPENQRTVGQALGSVTTTTDDGETYEEITPTGASDVAALDSDSDVDSRTENENIILVGGPIVNDLTETLAENNQTWTADEYNEGEGLLQYVSDGFTDGYDALVVSGWNGEDTRAAADFLVEHDENSDALEGSTQLRVDTETGEVAE